MKLRRGKISAKDRAKLEAYESAKGRGDTKGMKAALAPDPVPQPQPQPEGAPPADPPGDAPPADPAVEATPERTEPLPPPPPVQMGSPKASSSGGRWQDKYQLPSSAMDGREMACVFIGDQWVGMLQALEDDLKLIGKEPVIAAAQLRNVIIIALDQMLPDRVKLTPPIAAAVGSTTIAVQRIRHHKAITEVQKHDPRIEDYKRKVAEDAARERAERAAKDQAAKDAAAKDQAEQAAKEPPIVTADPPPEPPAPAPIGKVIANDPPINGAEAADGKLFA